MHLSTGRGAARAGGDERVAGGGAATVAGAGVRALGAHRKDRRRGDEEGEGELHLVVGSRIEEGGWEDGVGKV